MDRAVDPAYLRLATNNYVSQSYKEYQYLDSNIKVNCWNDKTNCVDWFSDKLNKLNDGSIAPKVLPFGISSEGSFTFKNGTKDIANGTLDYMMMVVDRTKFDLTNTAHYSI